MVLTVENSRLLCQTHWSKKDPFHIFSSTPEKEMCRKVKLTLSHVAFSVSALPGTLLRHRVQTQTNCSCWQAALLKTSHLSSVWQVRAPCVSADFFFFLLSFTYLLSHPFYMSRKTCWITAVGSWFFFSKRLFFSSFFNLELYSKKIVLVLKRNCRSVPRCPIKLKRYNVCKTVTERICEKTTAAAEVPCCVRNPELF